MKTWPETGTAIRRVFDRKGPTGRRTKGRPKFRYLDNLEEDLNTIEIKAWRRAVRNRGEWKRVLNETLAHNEL